MGQQVLLSLSETRHLKEVLRLGKGDLCLVTDGRGHSAEARVQGESSGQALLIVQALTAESGSSMLKLKLYPALLQKGKMDGLIEKAQELAVQEVIPLETKHTVLKMDESAKMKVLSRWQKIAQEAAKQSGASRLVQIQAPQKFEKAAASVPAGERAVLFHPSPEAGPFAEWTESLAAGETLHLFLGPEGGFADLEVEKFLKGPGKREIVRLGDTILKADTAFIGIVSALRFLHP